MARKNALVLTMEEIQAGDFSIRKYLHEVEKALWKRCGSIEKAQNLLSPLTWYIDTGRATLEFMRALVSVRPYYIACVLMKGGSDMAVIEAIKCRIGYEAYDISDKKLEMTEKNILTMEEIQAGLSEAHSEEEKMNFLMSLTVKQLKEFAKHQDCIGIKSSMKKADIAECIINNIEMDEVMQETPEQLEIGTKQPDLNEISEGQPVDCEAENRTVEKVLALYVPPKESVKNIHRLSKSLIAEQRLEKWKVKHAVFWARGMPDKTKRKFLKRLEEFL